MSFSSFIRSSIATLNTSPFLERRCDITCAEAVRVELRFVNSTTLLMAGRPFISSSPPCILTSVASANSITPAPLGSNHFTLTGTTTGYRSLRRFFPLASGSSNTNFFVVTSYLQSFGSAPTRVLLVSGRYHLDARHMNELPHIYSRLLVVCTSARRRPTFLNGTLPGSSFSTWHVFSSQPKLVLVPQTC